MQRQVGRGRVAGALDRHVRSPEHLPAFAVVGLGLQPRLQRADGIVDRVVVVNTRGSRATDFVTSGAAELCMQFPTGGGRAAAAGINDLPADSLDAFIAAFGKAYAG